MYEPQDIHYFIRNLIISFSILNRVQDYHHPQNDRTLVWDKVLVFIGDDAGMIQNFKLNYIYSQSN